MAQVRGDPLPKVDNHLSTLKVDNRLSVVNRLATESQKLTIVSQKLTIVYNVSQKLTIVNPN